MRMQFGSRLGGLAGMRPSTSMAHLLNKHAMHAQKLSVIRPFLELTREDLRTFCVENELEWVEDPTNSDEKYMRTRMRNLLAGATRPLFALFARDVYLEDVSLAVTSCRNFHVIMRSAVRWHLELCVSCHTSHLGLLVRLLQWPLVWPNCAIIAECEMWAMLQTTVFL